MLAKSCDGLLMMTQENVRKATLTLINTPQTASHNIAMFESILSKL